MISRIASHRVPIAFTDPEPAYTEDYVESFPLLDGYLAAHYQELGTIDFGRGYRYRVLVRRDLRPSSTIRVARIAVLFLTRKDVLLAERRPEKRRHGGAKRARPFVPAIEHAHVDARADSRERRAVRGFLRFGIPLVFRSAAEQHPRQRHGAAFDDVRRHVRREHNEAIRAVVRRGAVGHRTAL